MKRILALYFVLAFNISNGQSNPTIYKHYYNNENKWAIEHLILSSDGVFFSIVSCECGIESYGKGRWYIKGQSLYLQGYDSTKVFPNATLNFIKGISNDSITIKGLDYFGRPTRNLLLAMVNPDSSISRSYEFLGKDGKLTVSKKQFIGFFLVYESKAPIGLVKREDYYTLFDNQTSEIIIQIDFGGAGLDRVPEPLNYGNHRFKIRGDNLYRPREKKEYFIQMKEH